MSTEMKIFRGRVWAETSAGTRSSAARRRLIAATLYRGGSRAATTHLIEPPPTVSFGRQTTVTWLAALVIGVAALAASRKPPRIEAHAEDFAQKSMIT
jgi:hypothetical protein